jgi:cytosine/creatinine deaminase
MEHPTLLRDCRLPDGTCVDLLLAEGRIAAIEPAGTFDETMPVIEAEGRLVTPGLADLHLHPDKAYGLDSSAESAATIAEAIAAVRQQKPGVRAADVCERTLTLLRSCLSFGTTRVRVHAEVDPLLGLRSVEGVLEARERMLGRMTVQVVAFPQEGIVKEPGTLELMDAAIRMGCDVVGAITYQDPDTREHLAAAARLAAQYGVPLDIHADLGVRPESTALNLIADVAGEYSLDGRVAAGHCTTLAAMDSGTRARVLSRLEAHRITVLSLPRTDLFLDRAVAPFEEIQRCGVECHVATNNVRNAFTPVGKPSLPSSAVVCALATGIRHRSALARLAHSLWETDLIAGPSAVAIGHAADLCIWPVPEVWRLIADEPEPDVVLVNGSVVPHRRPASEV